MNELCTRLSSKFLGWDVIYFRCPGSTNVFFQACVVTSFVEPEAASRFFTQALINGNSHVFDIAGRVSRSLTNYDASGNRGLGDRNPPNNSRLGIPIHPHHPRCCECHFKHAYIHLIFVQQCQLVTPLQLYFSYKSAFTNVQVLCLQP
jgi:hypothetical protein